MDPIELNKIFKQKRQRINLADGKITGGFVTTTFPMFLQWYDQKAFDKGCHYCETKNETTLALYQAQRDGRRSDATRGGKRGKRLEIDRRNPFIPYDDLSNLVWCCYWCNNAKSNFFNEDEFKPIAQEIGKSLKAIHHELLDSNI